MAPWSKRCAGQLPIWHGGDAAGRRSGSPACNVPPIRVGKRWNGLCNPPLATKTTAMVCLRNIALATMSLLLLGGMAGCAHQDFFPGTTIVRTEENRKIIETVEQYRRRLVERNVEGLLVLASPKYFEDSGTPRSDDDYGFEGLRQVLASKLKRVKSLRYEIEYRSIRVSGGQAEVHVFLDGSFELAADSGDRYRRVNDYHRFTLEQEEERWKFVAGM
jgi:hypothetical protein